MSQSIRFLGIAVLAWAGVRAVSLGLVPGTQALAFDLPAERASLAQARPVEPTQLPPLSPVAPAGPWPPAPAGASAMGYGQYGGYPPTAFPAYAP
jgi:hypothetical protein